MKTGLLADDLGTQLLQAFKTLQAFHEATPFGGTMTDAQRTFLTNELASWDTVSSDIIDKTARNGMVQARVDDVKVDLTARQNSLKGMIGDIVDANMPVASVELEKATLALQASTQVFITLRDSSLLNALK